MVLLVAGTALGQGTTGTIRIQVSDESQAPVPGATVSAESPDVLGSRTEVTDASGVVTLSGLAPSPLYVVTVTMQSFNTQRFENVLVKSGSTTSLAAELTVAAVKEEIIVVAETPLVDMSSTVSGQDITLQLTESLPTGRTYQSYLQLVPGVAPVDPSVADENPAVRSGLNYGDIGGLLGRSRDNFYYIEGIDVTDPYSGYFGANLNTEIIQEQSVITGGIPAEYIGSPGLISSVITKAGGNEFHGSLNYYFQSDSLVADNENVADASFSTYDTAFTLGGPMVADKAWFFASYRLLNREEDVANLNTGVFMRTVTSEADQAFAKLSWSVTPSIKLTGTFLSDPTTIDGETDFDIINNRSQVEETGGNRYILNYSQVIGSAYLSLTAGEHNGEASVYAADQSANNDVYFLQEDISNYSLEDEQLGGRGLNDEDKRDNEFLKGKFEWYLGSSWGDHTLTFGAELNDHINTFTTMYPGGAQYGSLHTSYLGTNAQDITDLSWTGRDWRVTNTSDFVGMISAIDASPNSAMHYSILDLDGDGVITMEEAGQAVLFDSTEGNPNGMVNYYRITERMTGPQVLKVKGTTLYLQDSYKRERLTINAGLRAEEWKHVGTNGVNIYTFDYDIAPRIGAIYDLTGEGRMKVSAFYGRYYDPVRMNMSSFAGTLSGRVREEQVFVNGEWLTYRTRGYTDAAFAPTTKTPYTDDLQLTFEMELGNNMSFEAIYIDRKTRDILEDYDLCLYAECTDGTNYYPGDINAEGSLWLGLDYFGYTENPGTNFVIGTLYAGKRDWTGVEFVFRKRYSDNWQMLGSYTWADAMGNTNSDSNADFQGDVEWLDPRSPNQWARQPGMIEHLFKVAGSYHWDNGFQVGGTYRWNSGTVASRTWAIYRRNLPEIVSDDEAYTWNGATSTWLTEDAVGSIKNDSWGSLDARVQYNHDFGFLDGEFFLDIYNVLDDQAAVRNEDLVAGTGATEFGEGIQWVPPRRFYIGARLSF
jgi:hypothetical protein